jgi:hypothetical protein
MNVYGELNVRWKQTSKLMFGGEVGELAEFAPWLSEGLELNYSAKSALSSKPVAYSSKKYDPNAKWLSFEEVDFGKKFEPLKPDELKDIDAIVQAISDRVYYTGNVVLGNSAFVDASANISDSHYVYNSSESGDSKYLAYSNLSRICENIFGSSAPGESSYCIRCNDTYRVKRCFELWQSVSSFDCYYVFSVMNCSDCMFSFNLRSKRYAIGNRVLDKDTYMKIKNSLLSQMRDELKSKKRLPSLLEIVSKCRDNSEETRRFLAAKIKPVAETPKAIAPIDEAFAHTASVLLGISLRGIQNHATWLSKNLHRYAKHKSIVSGRSVFVGDYGKYFSIPPERMLKEEEALVLAESAKPNPEISQISLSNAHKFIEDVAFFSLDIYAGNNSNIIDCQSYADSKNCLNCFPCVGNSNSAYNFWPRSSERVFGSSILFDSASCINCHHSVKLNRCFEVDSSRDCSDCYFCHNCENVRESMFCFNVKNLSYAIGNVEVGKEKYMELKKKLLAEIGNKIERDGKLEFSIFDLATRSP